MIVVPDAGTLKLLAMTLGSSETIDTVLSLRLFVNNYTPDHNTITSNFTEAAFPGYARIAVNRADWQPPVLSGGRATMLLFTAPSTWAPSGAPVTIYGVYAVGATTGVTLFCERFATPQVVSPGEILRYRCQFRGRQEP